MSVDPYAPPRAELEVPPDKHGELEEWVAVRKEHLGHEARVRGVSLFFFLPAAAFALLGGGSLIATVVDDVPTYDRILTAAFGAGFSGLAVLYAWVGRGLRQLNAKVRIPTTVLAGLMMLSPPVGTGIGAYILYLLHSQKGRTVFSDTYREIRVATPHLVYRTSKVAWVALFLLVFGLVLLVGLALA